MRDLGNIAGNVDDLRRERDALRNPPDYDMGQGSDGDWNFFDDDSSGMSEMSDSSFGGSDMSNGAMFNGNDLSTLGGFGNTGLPSTQQDYAKSLTASEDKWIELFKKVCKTGFGWFKELTYGIRDGASGNTHMFWASYGRRVLVSGGILVVVGGLLWIFSIFSPILSRGVWVFTAGCFLLMIGVMLMGFNMEEAREEYKEIQNNEGNDEAEEEIDMFSDDEDSEEDDSWSGWGSDESEEEEVEEEFDPWANLSSMEDEEGEEPDSTLHVEDINIDAAIDDIPQIQPHTQTRQFLYEQYMRVLPVVNPDFAQLKEIPEEDNNFVIFDKLLKDSALQTGMKEDNLPELEKLRENLFIIQLKSTRPTGMKEEEIANELANLYSKDEFGMVVHEGVSATTSSVGRSLIINIFKGEGHIISMADTYRQEKDWLLNPKIRKPVVMGINELGKVWTFDAEKVFSYIISGVPRSGKSWSAKALITQMCMFSSPKEILFEAFDVKDGASDYYEMNGVLPHFRGFYGNAQDIMRRLRYITTEEAERRTKILKEYKKLNIADLKEKNPDVEMPYLYVVIDELIGLKDKLSKEEDAEFKSLVNALITQMPNLGIRMILIPHRVTNDIVSKTTYVNVSCMACVKSTFGEIKNTLDVTKKDFPYTLSNIGDMALKMNEINSGKPVFCHGIGITPDNESTAGVYRFIGSLWEMLEPEYCSKKFNEVGKSEKYEKRLTRSEDYIGHDLESIHDVVEEEDFSFDSDDSVDESFWDEFQ